MAKSENPKTVRPVDEPCVHMENLVNGLHDNRLGFFARLYTLFHVLHCERCRRFLDLLGSLGSKTAEVKAEEPSADILERLKSGAWRDKIDRTPPAE